MSPISGSRWLAIGRFLACFICLWGVFSASDAGAALRKAQFAHIDYDVVYVRCPRGKPIARPSMPSETLQNWNGVNDVFLSATNNVYQAPGCDLVLHHSAPDYKNLSYGDPGREEVLVDCDEDDQSHPVCTIADPNVSFDGTRIVYAKWLDTRQFVTNLNSNGNNGVQLSGAPGVQTTMRIYPNGNGPGGVYAKPLQYDAMMPYDSPTLIYEYDLKTHTERQVSPNPVFWSGRAYPNVDTNWQSAMPVMDTGPFYLPDGRIGFTSNRADGYFRFELFAMDKDGNNLEKIGWRAMANQLHPFVLKDGRIAYTSLDRMLQRIENNNFSLFTINPDDSNPFILAGKQDSTELTYHYATQLSNGDIVVDLYYIFKNTGMGTLLRFPIDPPGPDFAHLNKLNYPDPFVPDHWIAGRYYKPFSRVGQYELTVQSSAGDNPAIPYQDPADDWISPYDGHTVTMMGKYSHPAAAPDNGLLVTYCIGQCSTNIPPLTSLAALIGKDTGIWLLPDKGEGVPVEHIADDGRIVVDSPNYQEIMPRAVVPYSRIYGIPHPVIKPVTKDDGLKDPRLAAGEPFGLTGAATLYDRETRALNGTPWNMNDDGGVMSGRAYTNMQTSGAELAIFDNSEIYGIRVLMPVPRLPDNAVNAEQWVGYQKHFLRIMGEFPVRKPDGTLLDGQGNPDTSFIVKLPANTPFLFQTIDKRGMALDIETTSRNVARGEVQLCGGCHVHTRESLDPFKSPAWLNKTASYGDFSGNSAPLFQGNDANGNPTVASAADIYSGIVPGVASRHSFAVDWENNVSQIIQQYCASCHAEGQSAQQLTGLRLDGTDKTYDLLVTNQYTREDGVNINSSTKPGDGLTDIDALGTDRITPHYSCCTVSRWLSINSARSSMLVWALYGERLDGRDNTTGLPPSGSGVLVDDQGREHPEIWPKVAQHAAYLTNMPEADKRLIARWIDLGAPKVNSSEDLMRPVLTLTPVNNGDEVDKVLVGLWDDSPLDYSRFKVTVNGVDITPNVQGTPDVVEVSLPTPVTQSNADSMFFSFEIWDHPDRSQDYISPGVGAANRSRRNVTGQDLLRLADIGTNSVSTDAANGDGSTTNPTTGNTDNSVNNTSGGGTKGVDSNANSGGAGSVALEIIFLLVVYAGRWKWRSAYYKY